MKIEQTHIDQIKKQFAELRSKDDLVKLLSDVKNMLYGQECNPVQLKSLTYYANPVLCKNRYKTFTIKKKSGEDRTIHAPVKGLKSILRTLNFVLQCMYKPHEAANGFVLEKSIVDNAQKHVGHHYVYNIDLKDFFYSFDRNRVKLAFMYEPFNLREDKEPLAFLLASLCTHPLEINGEIRYVLPQGSPTSPTLTNILCRRLDHRLSGLAKRFGAVYSRYADDITFSSYHNIFNREENPKLNDKGCYDNFLAELERLLSEEGLKINPNKTRLQKAGYRQEATGLVVNEKVNVRRRYVKQIRMWLYYWEKYGYEKAEQIFKKDYKADKGHVKNKNAHLINVLEGKLEFLRMVKGEYDNTFVTLENRIKKLYHIKNNESNEDNKIKFRRFSEIKPVHTANNESNFKPLSHIMKDRKLRPPNISEALHRYNYIATEKINKNISDNNLHFKPFTNAKDINTNSKGISEIKEKILVSYPKPHCPQSTVKLLKNFSNNNNDLKYTTHSWEYGKFENYNDFMKRIRKEWNKISKELQNQNIRLHAKINSFLFNDKLGQKDKDGYYESWGVKRLKFGWSSPELKEFCDTTNNNPLICPIPDHIKELDKQWGYLTFGDYVSVFKNEIEFREDSNNLKKLILDKRKQILSYDFKIELLNLEGISFYTDVAYFSKTIEAIFIESIKPRTEFPNILITIEKKEIFYLFKIIHLESICPRSIDDHKISNPVTGTISTIIGNMKNLADFSIEAIFSGGESYRINYLVSDPNTPFSEQLNYKPEGFTYIFKFYL